MKEYCIKSSSNICFGYLLEPPHWGDSNKYPNYMFYEEIRIKQGLSDVSVCPLRILYNSKFIAMATSLVTNDVVVAGATVSEDTQKIQQSGSMSISRHQREEG